MTERYESKILRPQTCKLRRVSLRAVYVLPVAAIAGSVMLLGWSTYAFVSLASGATPLRWTSPPALPGPTVPYVIHAAGDPTIGDGSDDTAIRLAFAAWEQVPGSRIAFAEDQSAASRARTDWRDDNLHLVMWDTTNESGFFDGAAGLVAITPVDFDPSNGNIIDADVLFNAKNYDFSTDLSGGTFDIQNVATHEIGHFIGLDHSAVVAATMNPFANTQDTRLRSLEKDDMAGASSNYAIAGPPGAIRGQVVKGGGAPVSGAHVVAEDLDGNPVSATLSDGAGNFTISGLDQGQYVVYAEPVDGPVRNTNFSLHTSGLTIDTDFGTTFFGATTGASSPETPDMIMVTFGATTQLPRTLVARPRAGSLNVTSASLIGIAPGQSSSLRLFGTGLNQCNKVKVPGFGVTLLNPVFGANEVRADIDVSGSALPQLRSVRIYNASNDCAVLTGGFEVRNPAPMLEGLDPATASPGQAVQAFGSNIAVGARVIVGGTVVNGSASGGGVTFTLPQLPNGTYSVAVENPDGQFAKLQSALVVQGSSATAPPAPPGTTTETPSAPAPSAAAPTGGQTGQSTGPMAMGGGGGGGGGCALGGTRGEESGALGSLESGDGSLRLLAALALILFLIRSRR